MNREEIISWCCVNKIRLAKTEARYNRTMLTLYLEIVKWKWKRERERVKIIISIIILNENSKWRTLVRSSNEFLRCNAFIRISIANLIQMPCLILIFACSVYRMICAR